MALPVDKSLRATLLLPLAILLSGLVFSALGAWWLANELQGRATAEFQRYAQRVDSEIERRFQAAVYGLYGVRSVFVASDQVSRAEFRDAVGSRNMQDEFPGVRGFGFIQWLKRADVPSFLAAERADGAPQFSIRELDKQLRDDLYVIKLIEPLANNIQAVGLDVGSEAVRRAGAQQAVDTGLATISGAITLVQDAKKTPGALLYVPLYSKHAALSTVAERRAALVGLLYAPIVINELLAGMADVSAQQVDFELFDAPNSMPPAALIFDADQHLQGEGHRAGHKVQRLFKSTTQLSLPGRTLTLHVSSAPQFEAAVDRLSPWLLLFAGILLSFFLAILLRQQAGGRARAEALAHSMTSDLERLAIVVRKTSNAVVITDRQRLITWVNAGFERISGFTAAEALGRSPGQLLQCASTSADTVARMRSALNRGQSFSGELLNRTKAGQEYLIELEIQPLHDELGALNGFMAIESDITQRRAEQLRLEAALREQAALLGTLHEHAIISVADRAGRITDVNDAFCRISGYSREELLGQNHRIVNSGLQSAEFWLAMWQAISHGESWHAVVCNKAKNGSLYWVDTTIAPFMNKDGKIEKYISIRVDITAAKEQEVNLRMARDQLAKAAEVAQLGVWTWGLGDDSLAWDSGMYRIYEMSPPLTGTLLYGDWRSRVHPDDVEVAEAKLQGAIVGSDVYDPVFRIYSRSGEIRYIQAAAIVERDASGKALLVMGINRDISAQYQAEALLREAKHSADEANRAKSEFLANMSHELRTPMNAILGMLTLLGKTELSSKQADYAAKSEGAARSLLALLNEILDFSKIEAGKMTLDPQPFAPDQLLRELSMILASNLNSKPVELLFDIDPRLPCQLYGDSMRLQQVLINLGGNAVKFTEHGEVRLSIKVLALDAVKVRLQFAVSDTGIGIAAENQQLIFSGFTQAEASITRRFGGTGLGVAISQRLVALMGGELKLDSVLGQGSRFYFDLELPLVAVDPDQPALPAPARKSVRALLVDDHASVRELLKSMGESLGWEVTLADSGERALRLLQEQQAAGQSFEVIFIDWQMPGLDGGQTSQLIRELASAACAPLIMMVTAHQREMLLQCSAAEQALLDGFLVKPVTASMLFDALVDAQAKKVPAVTEPLSLASAASSASQRLAGIRLLVVEDNVNNQQIACELLEGEGASVTIAQHGQHALEILAADATAFDVVLMDLQMPVMDGLTATRHIRQDMGLQQLPIVAMTANVMQSDREACEAAGMNEHVGKPFDLQHLVTVLCKQVGRQLSLAPPSNPESSNAPVLVSRVSEAAAQAGVDLQQALQFMGGQQELYERLLPMFLENLVAIPAQLRELLAQGDTQSASRQLHTLKGLAGQMGVTALALEAVKGEKQLAGTPSPEQAAAAVEQACSAIMQASPGLIALQQAFVAEQACEAEAKLPTVAIDRPALRIALHALVQLLENSDMQALAAIGQLQGQFAPALNEPLSALARVINALDFSQALTLCTGLLEEHAA